MRINDALDIRIGGQSALRAVLNGEIVWEPTSAAPAIEGKNWQTVDISNTNLAATDNVNDVATDSDGVWVAVGQNGWIIRSTDDGATWTDVHKHTHELRSIHTDYNGVFIASAANGRVVKSTDNGVTWSNIATAYNSVLGGIYTDGGGNWVAAGRFLRVTYSLSDGASGTWNGLEFPPNNGGMQKPTYYQPTDTWMVVSDNQFCWTSNDSGVTWTQKTNVGTGPYSLTVTTQGEYFAGCNNGVIRKSEDEGDTWTVVSPSGSNQRLSGINISKNNLTMIAVGNNGAVTRSVDEGATWESEPNIGSNNLLGIASSATGTWVAVGSNRTLARSLPVFD